ncbi:hypothetical protein A3D00_02720 [Candidatus Woesebacteria bacterium RIFCSPHIGHO2_02_FULL_38_9]|uniref:Uncharacterized protein n=1 Tax=Candidatus Woesebacteria bacterium RIFCSPHIGHO2_01_FULL_39_28 TaxID=1802496 RepID=A0A1F7YEA2_9BACT|nr:MAG: hypothetical protein A2627_04310 [Candidatus Woesebacteria bacterium RIFCSPHIGHO2_01_FULL_39_28]OGM35163.1 MAG: hypothetical protein A3D00_02720 [Candidatus Woesebacteria bacterium RIFCSPHIGHO2_02_FULL_38_9]OGM57753.1 MAG: hypothetical protein A3A50_05570 [Candidatus Woesebacteria bacterium RIFCSPLOWO2_01_FULL_38_20]
MNPNDPTNTSAPVGTAPYEPVVPGSQSPVSQPAMGQPSNLTTPMPTASTSIPEPVVSSDMPLSEPTMPATGVPTGVVAPTEPEDESGGMPNVGGVPPVSTGI